MVSFVQIEKNEIFDEKEKEILQRHLNDMFRRINAFMICMVPGFVAEENIPDALKNDSLVRCPDWACPVSMGEGEERTNCLRDLIMKVFDEEQYYELSIHEKYVLAHISNEGIQREECVIDSFVEKKMKKELSRWMRLYKIKDIKEREIIKKKVLGEDADNSRMALDWLTSKGITYKNHVVASIGSIPLLKYEYPFAIMALFSEEEWNQILQMQELEIAIGRGRKDVFES